MTKYAGTGIDLQMDDGQGTKTSIGQLRDVTGPSLGKNTEDVTTHGSSGNWREIVSTIKTQGEVTFTIVYDPTDSTHDASDGLLSVLDSNESREFDLIFPDDSNTTWTFTAEVTGFEPSGPVDGAFTADITLEPTGQPTLA